MGNALLHIEQLPGDQLRIQIKDAPTVTRMLRTAMESNANIAAMFTAAVVHWIESSKIPYEEVKKLYIP